MSESTASLAWKQLIKSAKLANYNRAGDFEARSELAKPIGSGAALIALPVMRNCAVNFPIFLSYGFVSPKSGAKARMKKRTLVAVIVVDSAASLEQVNSIN